MRNASVQSFALSIGAWEKRRVMRGESALQTQYCYVNLEEVHVFIIGAWEKDQLNMYVVARAKEGTGKVIMNQWHNKNRAIILT